MLFPILIHKDPDSGYGVTIPDIPGCFTAGDTLSEALANVQEAVECHLDDEEPAPEPSDLETHLANPDYADGIWVMVDIDFSFQSRRRVRVNITLPENVLCRIDETARRRRMSRSAYLLEAARRELAG